MSKKIKPQVIRRHISSELIKFSQCIRKVRGIIDAGSLDSAATKCLTSKPKGDKNAWGYDLNNMMFKFKTPRKTLPDTARGYLDLELSVSVNGNCSSLVVGDPFTALSVNIEISMMSPQTKRRSISAWHFDRHMTDPKDKLPEEMHPLYHVHHGGRRMHSLEDYGEVLLLSAPRFHHPPMDAVLAVDFVLANFLPTEWRKLQDDGIYTGIVKSAQKRYWIPYMQTLLGTPPQVKPQQTVISPNELCPMMIIN